MKGKTALITGSTSGIGKGIAQSLAKKGCNIILNGFGDINEINKLKDEIESENNVKALYLNADMTDSEQISQMIKQAVAEFDSIDILINNAGVQHVDYVEDFPKDRWDAIIAINLSSAFHTISNAIPHMKKQNSGRIINIASAHGLVASEKKAAYVAAKHGIIGLTKTVGLEIAKYNITCNAICPGWVLTPLVQQQIDKIAENESLTNEEAKIKLLSEKQPSQQFVQIEEIGEFAAFLCRDEAKQINGSALSIDGGWTAR